MRAVPEMFWHRNRPINVFPPRVEPPEAGQIRELYEQLWGNTGPDCVLPSKGNASNEIGVLEMLAPIREEEVILKLGRMKSGVSGRQAR